MALDLSFGICIGAVDGPGTSDRDLYRRSLADAALAARLGYDGVWMLEHHFSDYYPTPNPLLLLAHVAARWPGLELGTMVLVAPWHHPLRLAEDIAMLSLLTDSALHLGLGRGSAALEYEAFGIELDQSRERFQEVIEVVQRALFEGRVEYHGRHIVVPRAVALRPHPDRARIHLYGAITSPGSATIMAELGLPLFCNAIRPQAMHVAVLEAWAKRMHELGREPSGTRLLQIHLIVADTDDEAIRLARQEMPRFFAAQVAHYASDLERYATLKSFEFRRMHEMRVRLSHPENLDDFIALQLIGAPRTIARRLEDYVGMGFNKFVVTTNTPDIPEALRHRWLERFAREVAPAFSTRIAGAAAAGDGAPAP